MLGKLLKYDLKDILKSMSVLYIILIIMAIVVRGFDYFSNDIKIFNYIIQIPIVVFVIICVASALYCFFLSIKHFYRKILKDEGYLTNTLPVTKNAVILSKLISAILCMILTVLIIIVSCLIAFYNQETFSVIWQFIENTISQFGYTTVSVFMFFSIYLLISYIATLLVFYCALSVGHSRSDEKLAYSIVSGIVIYFVFQFLNILGVVIACILNPGALTSVVPPSNFMTTIFSGSMICQIIVFTFCYITTNYCLKNKLNLE